MKKNIKFIIHAKEWFDLINGNSYFSAIVTRVKDGKELRLPFQYGYGDHYIQMTFKAMKKEGWIRRDRLNWKEYHTIKEQDCLKKEVQYFGKEG